MSSKGSLPGIEQLLEVMRQHKISAELFPARKTSLQAGEKLAGQPVDPLLAVAYQHVGGLAFKPWHHLLLRCDDEVNGLFLENQEWHGFWPHPFWSESFRALMLFGTDMGYRYATVPELANREGAQPVVYLDSYEDIYALPVASDVNRFFLTYSHYLEMVADEPEFMERHVPSVSFPWGVPELLAQDAPLVEMIHASKFDRWMYSTTTGSNAAVHEWVAKVLLAHNS